MDKVGQNFSEDKFWSGTVIDFPDENNNLWILSFYANIIKKSIYMPITTLRGVYVILIKEFCKHF